MPLRPSNPPIRTPTPRIRQLTSPVLLLLSAIILPALHPQAPTPQGTPRSWAQAASDNELAIIDADTSFPLRYRVHKVDAKGDITREVIESKLGTVARLIERNGQPITPEEDAGERDRLTQALNSPDDFLRHQRREAESRDYSRQLIRLLPSALLYTYVPGQSQPPPASSPNAGPQIVLDFHPDPAFHPPNMLANLLTGLEGRVWIDAASKRMTRVEARVLRPVNFGFGMIAHLYPGGTVVFEQTRASPDRWVFAHLEEHLTVRELMLKTVPQNSVMTSSDFRPLPAPISYQDAIRTLLAMPIPLH